jgi:hypothetical protein
MTKKTRIFVIIYLFILLSMWVPSFQIIGNSGPPANLNLRVFYESHAYDLDILIYQDTPLSSDQISLARSNLTIPMTMQDLYYKEEYPEPLIEFQDQDGYVSNTLYGSVSYFWGDHDASSSFGRYVMMLHVPRVFKIVLINDQGHMIISDIITMESYDYKIDWNIEGISFLETIQYGVGEISGLMTNPWLDYRHYLNFFIRLCISLLIELGIFFFFGFRKKSSFILLIGLNTVTQFILSFILVQALFQGLGSYHAYTIFLISEFYVFVAEMIFVGIFIKEKKWWQRTLLVFIANMASLLIGLYITSQIVHLFFF